MPSTSAPQRTSVNPKASTETLSWLHLVTPTGQDLSIQTTTVIPLPDETLTPTSSHNECSILDTPEEGVVYNQERTVKFVREAVSGSGKYLLEIANSSGWLLSIETTRTYYDVSPSMFPGTTQYSWTVVALDSSGQQICHSQLQNFSLAVVKRTSTSKPEREDGAGLGEGNG